MPEIDVEWLYNVARSRHVNRRDQALSSARRAVRRPGYCAASLASEQIRAWFDQWEEQLWETYLAEKDRLNQPKEVNHG